jgi:ribonuclease HI
MSSVAIYTDGSSRYINNVPTCGAWAAILIFGNHQKELVGTEDKTTNGRMELMGPIMALETLKWPCDVVLTSDAEYVIKGITQYIDKWKTNRWRTTAKKPVANQDLWIRLDAAREPHNITWKWVKGHADNKYNNRCDELATAASAALKEKLA